MFNKFKSSNMRNGLILIILSLIIFPLKSQSVITEIDIYKLNIDSIENVLSKFIYNQDSTLPVTDGIFFYDFIQDTLYFQYDSILFFDKKERLFYFYTGMVHHFTNILLTNKETAYIVNMQNPLDSILNQVNLIKNFSTEFLFLCSSQIKRIHYENWVNKSDIKPYYIDEEGIFQKIDYNPKSW